MNQRMTLEQFKRWLVETAVTVAGPYDIVPCACTDINCHGWRLRPMHSGVEGLTRYTLKYGGRQLPPVETVDPDGLYVRYAEVVKVLQG